MAEKPLNIALGNAETAVNANNFNNMAMADIEAFALGAGNSAFQERAEELRTLADSDCSGKACFAQSSDQLLAFNIKKAWVGIYGTNVESWPTALKDSLESIEAGIGLMSFNNNFVSALQNLQLEDATFPAFDAALLVAQDFSPANPVAEGFSLPQVESKGFIPSSAARAGLSFITDPFMLIAPIWAGGIAGRAVTGLTANMGRAIALTDGAIAGLAAAFGLVGESTAFVGASRVIANSPPFEKGGTGGIFQEIASSAVFFGMLRVLGTGTNFIASLLPATRTGVATAKIIGHAGSIMSLAATEELQENMGLAPATSTTAEERLWRAAFLHTVIQTTNSIINVTGVPNGSEQIMARARLFIEDLRNEFAPSAALAAADHPYDSGDLVRLNARDSRFRRNDIPTRAASEGSGKEQRIRELSFEDRKLPLLSEGERELRYGFPDDPYVVIVEKDGYVPQKSPLEQDQANFQKLSSIGVSPAAARWGVIDGHAYSVVENITGYRLSGERELSIKEIGLIMKLLTKLVRNGVNLTDFRPENIMIGRLAKPDSSEEPEQAWVTDPALVDAAPIDVLSSYRETTSGGSWASIDPLRLLSRYLVVGTTIVYGKPPIFHIQNPKVGLLPKGTIIELPGVKTIESDRYYSIGGERDGELNRILRTSDDGRYFETVSPVGERRYFKVLKSRPHIKMIEVDMEETPFTRTEIQAPLSDTEIKQMNRTVPTPENMDELADILTETQVSASETAREMNIDIVTENLRQANEFLLREILANEDITVEDIKHVNKLVNHGLIEGEHKVGAGVLRGTIETGTEAGVTYRIDLMSAEGGQKLDDQTLFNNTPAKDVPSSMDALVARINGLGRNPTLKDVVSVAVDFLKIHPFIDGNGRTERVLIDCLLIKIGMPPLPHDFDLTRDTSYLTLAEVINNYRMAYKRAQDGLPPPDKGNGGIVYLDGALFGFDPRPALRQGWDLLQKGAQMLFGRGGGDPNSAYVNGLYQKALSTSERLWRHLFVHGQIAKNLEEKMHPLTRSTKGSKKYNHRSVLAGVRAMDKIKGASDAEKLRVLESLVMTLYERSSSFYRIPEVVEALNAVSDNYANEKLALLELSPKRDVERNMFTDYGSGFSLLIRALESLREMNFSPDRIFGYLVSSVDDLFNVGFLESVNDYIGNFTEMAAWNMSSYMMRGMFETAKRHPKDFDATELAKQGSAFIRFEGAWARRHKFVFDILSRFKGDAESVVRVLAQRVKKAIYDYQLMSEIEAGLLQLFGSVREGDRRGVADIFEKNRDVFDKLGTDIKGHFAFYIAIAELGLNDLVGTLNGLVDGLRTGVIPQNISGEGERIMQFIKKHRSFDPRLYAIEKDHPEVTVIDFRPKGKR